MPDNTESPRPECPLPTIGERVTLALSILHPETDDLAAAAAEHITATHDISVTAEHITSLIASDVASVPDPVVDAVVDSTQLPHAALFGDDTDAVMPIWSNLRVLQELQDATPGLIQLRAGTALSPQAREDLLHLLDPSRRNRPPHE